MLLVLTNITRPAGHCSTKSALQFLKVRGMQVNSLPPAWFFSGMNVQAGTQGQWGFGDNVSVYSEPWATNRGRTLMQI